MTHLSGILIRRALGYTYCGQTTSGLSRPAGVHPSSEDLSSRQRARLMPANYSDEDPERASDVLKLDAR
jgi:hypothetical protein